MFQFRLFGRGDIDPQHFFSSLSQSHETTVIGYPRKDAISPAVCISTDVGLEQAGLRAVGQPKLDQLGGIALVIQHAGSEDDAVFAVFALPGRFLRSL
jgi:hypothetical protein